jgi:hypothetical protein
MNQLEADAVRMETIARLVDVAIADAVRGTRVGMAVQDLMDASGADAELLLAALEAARRLAETTPNEQLEVAVVHLRAAHRYLGTRVAAAPC